MKHAAHRMHAHSLEAYAVEGYKLETRKGMILAWLAKHGPATDRDVQRGLGFSERGAVQPRITELVEAGALVEVRETACPLTGRTVRVVGLPPVQRQFWGAA